MFNGVVINYNTQHYVLLDRGVCNLNSYWFNVTHFSSVYPTTVSIS